MSDIVVTIPIKEHQNWDQEIEKILAGEMKVWSLCRKPSKLKNDERVYFVRDGKVVASMRVVEIKANSSIICSTTKRSWAGRYQLFLDQYQEEDIKIQVQGFQAFRYRWW